MQTKRRPPEPEFLTQWREWLAAGPPKCCHTCDFYGLDGKCVEFGIEPPIEFTAQSDQCDRWVQELPF
jgi:hypothetical protein